MTEDRAESYARMKIDELRKAVPDFDINDVTILDKLLVDAVRYGQALGPHREAPHELP